MKKYLLFLSILPFYFSISAQTWAWGKIGNDGGNVTDVWGAAADTKGNGFFAGAFPSDITFGAITLYTQSSNTFLVKYDTSGNVLWAKQSIVPSLYSVGIGYKVATDGLGNSFITGWFADTISFDSYMLKTRYNAYLEGDVFVAKYDPYGNVLWAKEGILPSSNSTAYGTCVATDAAGNLYLSGVYTDTVTFGAFMLTPNSGGGGIFLVKYDPAGNVLWAKKSNATSIYSFGQALAIVTDSLSNIYLTGTFNDTISFGAVQLSGNFAQALTFLVKFDANGNALWGNYMKAPATKGRTSINNGNSVVVDKSENVYLTGYYTDTMYVGPVQLIVPRYKDGAFLVKYDSVGNQVWVKASGTLTATNWAGYSLAIDECNQIYFSGGGNTTGTNGSLIFDGDTIESNPVFDNSFILKLDTSGHVICGSIIASGGDDLNGVAADPTGRYVYLGGDMQDDMVFGKDSLTVGGFGGEQAFFVRWKPSGSFCNYACSAPSVIVNTPPPACAGDSVTLTASGAATYIWFPPTGLASSNSASTKASPSGTTTYTVVGANGNCTDTVKVTVTINPLPVAAIAKATDTICHGDSIQLNGSGGGTYSWNTGSTNSSIKVGPIASTTYTLYVSNALCSDSITVKVNVRQLPAVGLIIPTTVCPGQCITLKDTAGGAGLTYHWSNGATSDSTVICPNADSTVSLAVSNGCISTQSSSVRVYPITSLYACCDTVIGSGDVANLSVSGASNYTWNPAMGLNCDTCPNVTATPTVTTTYTVTGINSHGCIEEKLLTVIVELPCSSFIVPNVFTPNGDNVNDVLEIATQSLTSWYIVIFDRWGKEMFKSNNQDQYWDGKAEGGGEAPSGVYYYIINATCQGNTYKKDGFVQLIR